MDLFVFCLFRLSDDGRALWLQTKLELLNDWCDGIDGIVIKVVGCRSRREDKNYIRNMIVAWCRWIVGGRMSLASFGGDLANGNQFFYIVYMCLYIVFAFLPRILHGSNGVGNVHTDLER